MNVPNFGHALALEHFQISLRLFSVIFRFRCLLITEYLEVWMVHFLLVHCFPFPWFLGGSWLLFLFPAASCCRGPRISFCPSFAPWPCDASSYSSFHSHPSALLTLCCTYVVSVHWPFGVFPSMLFEQKRNLKLYYGCLVAVLRLFVVLYAQLNIFRLICLKLTANFCCRGGVHTHNTVQGQHCIYSWGEETRASVLF